MKLCGLCEPERMADVGAAKPDAVGFVLAASPRQVDAALLERLLAYVPHHVERWAVFREPDPDVLAEIAHLPLTGVQAHAGWGGEGLPASWAYLPVFLDGPALLDTLSDAGFRGQPRALTGFVGAFLVDGPRGGGQGVRVDVARAAQAAQLGPMVLAGGLTPENVRRAVREVRPLGVDVSSGTERAPGRKDPVRIRRFVQEARASDEGRM